MRSKPEASYKNLEADLRRASRHFPYPPTPTLTSPVRANSGGRSSASGTMRGQPRPRLIWLMAAILLLGLSLLSVPPLRAAVLAVIRLGAVRVFLIEPTPTQQSPATAPSPNAITPEASPSARPPLATALLNLAGETTLSAAQAQVDFPLRLPSNPPDLGAPDKVYLQDLNGQVVVLVWLKPDQPDQVRLSLHLLGPNTLVDKVSPQTIESTTVLGQPALWVSGPHLLQIEGQTYDLVRLVEGKVLIWSEGEITYRLESDLSLEAAIQIAESLP